MNGINTLTNSRPTPIIINFFAIVLGLLFGDGVFSASCGEWGFDCFFGAIFIYLSICVFGLVFAAVFYFRSEKLSILNMIGILLNGIPVFAAVLTGVLMLNKYSQT